MKHVRISSLAALLILGSSLHATEFEEPTVEQGCAEVQGGQLCYQTAGLGCPVVMVGGGSAMDSRQWDQQLRALGRNFRAVSADPRGLGKSSLPTGPYSDHDDFAALLDSLGMDRAVMVGLSSSGGFVLEFAAAYPERVLGVVASAPFLSTFPMTEPMKARVATFNQAGQLGGEAFLRTALADPHFIPAPRHPEARTRAKRLIAERFESSSSDPTWTKAFDPPIAARLNDVQAPTLLLVGALDHSDLHLRTEFLQMNIAGAQRLVIADGGHTLNLEQPEAFSKAVQTFVDSLNCSAQTR